MVCIIDILKMIDLVKQVFTVLYLVIPSFTVSPAAMKLYIDPVWVIKWLLLRYNIQYLASILSMSMIVVQILIHVDLTHWGRVTHIWVVDLTINGSDNGLSPGRRQAIIWTITGILLIGLIGTNFIGTNFNEVLIEINTFENAVWNLSAILSWPQYVNLQTIQHMKDSWNLYCYVPFIMYVKILNNFYPVVQYNNSFHGWAIGCRVLFELFWEKNNSCYQAIKNTLYTIS